MVRLGRVTDGTETNWKLSYKIDLLPELNKGRSSLWPAVTRGISSEGTLMQLSSGGRPVDPQLSPGGATLVLPGARGGTPDGEGRHRIGRAPRLGWGGLAARAGRSGADALYITFCRNWAVEWEHGGGVDDRSCRRGQARREGERAGTRGMGRQRQKPGTPEPAARAERPGRARAAARRRAAHPGAAVRAHRGVQGHRLPDARQAGGTRPGDDRGRAGGRPRPERRPVRRRPAQAPTWPACTWSRTWSAPPSRT